MTTPDKGFPATRRLILKGAGSVALAGLGIASFSRARAVAAANDRYPEDAFKQKDEKEAIRLLYGRTAEPSDKVKLDAPEIAENGAVVPISVSTTLTDVTSVSFLVSGKSERAGGLLQDSARHDAERGQSPQDGEDHQCDRDRGSGRQAL